MYSECTLTVLWMDSDCICLGVNKFCKQWHSEGPWIVWGPSHRLHSQLGSSGLFDWGALLHGSAWLGSTRSCISKASEHGLVLLGQGLQHEHWSRVVATLSGIRFARQCLYEPLWPTVLYKMDARTCTVLVAAAFQASSDRAQHVFKFFNSIICLAFCVTELCGALFGWAGQGISQPSS